MRRGDVLLGRIADSLRSAVDRQFSKSFLVRPPAFGLRVKRSRLLPEALVVFNLLSFCLAPATSAQEIKRPGVLAYGQLGAQSIYWINNERVIFIGGIRGDHQQLADGRHPPRRSLLEWNVRTGQLTRRADMPGEHQALCYDRGYVRYHYKTDDKVIVRAGSLGSEVEVAHQQFARGAHRFRVNPFTCREYDAAAVESKFGAGFVPLRDEHGYFGGRVDAREMGKAVYVWTADGAQKELLVPILGGSPRWSEFAGAYIFKRTEDLFSATKTTGKAWLLMPDGETREYSVPSGPWFTGSTGYGMSAAGLLMWSHAARAKADGMYLVISTGPTKLLRGYVYSFAVSPNGCSVAMSVDFQDKSSGDDAEFAAMNLCGGGTYGAA